MLLDLPPHPGMNPRATQEAPAEAGFHRARKRGPGVPRFQPQTEGRGTADGKGTERRKPSRGHRGRSVSTPKGPDLEDWNRGILGPTNGKAGPCLVLLLLFSLSVAAQPQITLQPPRALFGYEDALTITGTGAPPGAVVTVTLELPEGAESASTTVTADGSWQLTWPDALPAGSYPLTAVIASEGQAVRAEALAVIQGRGELPRRPLLAMPEAYQDPPLPTLDDFQPYTDRWRITPPPYQLTVPSSRWDPYNQNRWKGDLPILGQHIFLNLTARSDTLMEGRTLPTPSGVSMDRPGGIDFFGDDGQLFLVENVFLSADLFKGDTAFKPFDWRVKATLVGNVNYLGVKENAIVKPDVRRGTTRTDGRASLQELFFEYKIADLSASYDFVSVRAGIQPFVSDFRGFVFSDMNLGVRLFGNLHSNRTQFNLAFFERLEKDTNSGLNTFELRDQRVAVANVFRQDLFAEGYTATASLHYLQDDASFVFDRNGFLARPDPVGSFTPHEIEALYLGVAGFGHLGRFNIDHALYYVAGDDSLNPIAGADLFAERDAVDISAFMAAIEVSYDRDWFRPRIGYFYASGDDSPTDRDAEGFAAIFDNPNFAGGGFSFWNRMGIPLAGTGVALTSRGSLLPSVQSSKEEGQPNFVNPGLHLLTLGVDLELTPKLRSVITLNALRFDQTEVLELLLFQPGISKDLGIDASVGFRYRPFLNENFVVLGGAAAFVPGDGFADIYEDDSVLGAVFGNVVLTF